MSQIKLIEAYARLKSLKDNLPPGPYAVHEKYVHEYREILDLPAQISGVDLNSLQVPASELRQDIDCSDPSGEVIYTDERRCDCSS
jgi:hypothetical protein